MKTTSTGNQTYPNTEENFGKHIILHINSYHEIPVFTAITKIYMRRINQDDFEWQSGIKGF